MTSFKFDVSLALGLALILTAPAQAQWITVAKNNNAIQCESNGISLNVMQKELTQAKIPARRARCGSDGLVYPAVCGAGAGRLNIYDIPAKKLDAAAALGFEPLGTWPDANQVPCPRGTAFDGNAAKIVINGIGPAVDAKAYRKVRKLIGRAVTDNVISRFIVHGYGIEGGFSSCVQSSTFAPEGAFRNFIGKLQAIKANPNTTEYSITRIEKCTAETASLTAVEASSTPVEMCDSETTEELRQLLETHRQLHNKIMPLLQKTAADNAGQCAVLPVGSRPCGGPAQYSVYSTRDLSDTETADLVNDVENYNKLDAQVNKALGTISICSIEPEPQIGFADGHCRAEEPHGSLQ